MSEGELISELGNGSKKTLPASLKNPKPRQKYLETEEERQQLIDYIADKLLEGKNIRGIAREIGLNERTLYKYKVVAPARARVKDLINRKVVITYLQGHNINKTASMCKMDTRRVTKILHENGIKILSTDKARKVVDHITNCYSTSLSPLTIEIIEGGLLGDLYLHTKTHTSDVPDPLEYSDAVSTLHTIRTQAATHRLLKNLETTIIDYNKSLSVIESSGTARIRYHKSLLEYPWLQSLKYILRDQLTSNLTISSLKNQRFTARLDGLANIQLYKLRKRWYFEKTKILPSDFKLTPTKALGWFIGDGSIKKYDISLFSLNFTKAENELLKDLLSELGIKSIVKLYKYDNNPKDYYFIYISGKENRINFLQYLDNSNPFLITKAKEIFPYKFDSEFTKSNYIDSQIELYSKQQRKYLVIPTTYHHYKKEFINKIGFSYGKKAYKELFHSEE